MVTDMGQIKKLKTPMDPSSRTREWLPSVLILRGLWSEVFIELDYADDVALLAEMLEVLLLALEVMNQEAIARSVWRLIGTRPKYMTTVDLPPADPQQILIAGNPVQLVDKFTYLGSQLDR